MLSYIPSSVFQSISIRICSTKSGSMMKNNICCTCLQQKPTMFFPLSGGLPGQPSFREKLTSITSKRDYMQIVNAVICHKCSYFLDQAYKFKSDFEMVAGRFLTYVRKISALNKPIHCFTEIEQAAGLNLVLHKIEDTVNNYSLILGVASVENESQHNDSDSSCCILSDQESEHIEISDTETNPLLESIMPCLSPQLTSNRKETAELQCKQCPMTFFTRQNLRRHKRMHDQALDTINENIKHHMITDEDIRSIIGIRSDQRPTVTYTYYFENPPKNHDNTQQDDYFDSMPPVLSPQSSLTDHSSYDKKIMPLYADLVGASKCKHNPKLYQKGKSKKKRRCTARSVSVPQTWKYNPKVVLVKDDILDQRAVNELAITKKPSQIVSIIPKCVHDFLDDSCRTKTTLLYGNISKGVC